MGSAGREFRVASCRTPGPAQHKYRQLTLSELRFIIGASSLCTLGQTWMWREASLPEVPRRRAVDGLFLPDGFQPLGPGRHHGLPLFFRGNLGSKADLRGEDFKSTEVQRPMLRPQGKQRADQKRHPFVSFR